MLFWIRKRPARWAEAKRVHKSGQTKCLRLIKYKHNLHKHVVIVTDSKVWDCVETSDNNDIIICRTELRALKLASILWLENAQSLSSSTCGLSIYCTPVESSISLFMSTPPWVFWHGCFSSHGSIIDSTKQCHILIWIDRSLPLRVHAGYESGMHLPRSRYSIAGWIGNGRVKSMIFPYFSVIPHISVTTWESWDWNHTSMKLFKSQALQTSKTGGWRLPPHHLSQRKNGLCKVKGKNQQKLWYKLYKLDMYML